jgi:hypothetical protein
MILIWIIFSLTAGLSLLAILIFKFPTIVKSWQTIAIVDFWIITLLCIGESVARQHHLWHISFDSFSSTEMLGTQLGNIIFYLIVTTILSSITIIMRNSYKNNLRFRDVFFKKE